MSKDTGQKKPDEARAAIEALVCGVFTTYFGTTRPVAATANRILFPNGVELIDISATVGPANAQVFQFQLKGAGAAGAHGLLSQATSSGATAGAHAMIPQAISAKG